MVIGVQDMSKIQCASNIVRVVDMLMQGILNNSLMIRTTMRSMHLYIIAP